MMMPRSIELFTGTGGLALGIARAGFTHELLVEIDKYALVTLKQNRGRVDDMASWAIVEGEVARIDYSPHAGRIDLLAAGTPCQPFSAGGKHEGHRDNRNMFPEVFRAVREVRPRAILLENVRGLMRKTSSPYFGYILRQLTLPERLPKKGEHWFDHDSKLSSALAAGDESGEELRYEVHFNTLNVADFGVPQRRERIFVVALRNDVDARPQTPRRTHSRDALLYAQYVEGSYWREHELMPQPAPDRLKRRVQALSSGPPPAEFRWRTVRDALRGLPEPIEFKEHLIFPNHMGIPGARPYPGHTGSPMDEPAKTLKAGVHGVPGGENMLRRTDGSVRYFTPREAARIQTFPDEYLFSGPWSQIMRQIGNAVPVRLAECVAKLIRDALESVPERDPKKRET